jgi:hypothetical protein
VILLDPEIIIRTTSLFTDQVLTPLFKELARKIIRLSGNTRQQGLHALKPQ